MANEELARSIGERLRRAYNAKDREAVLRVLYDAEAEIDSSNLDGSAKRALWDDVHKAFNSGQLLFEKQEGSSLHQLMREIERRIAENKEEADKSR